LKRMEQDHRLELERTRIARDLHDSIGAGLTQVGMLTAELSQEPTDSTAIRDYSSQLSSQVLTLARELDAAVWVVSPRHDRLSSLCTYLGEFSLEFFRHSNIRCRVDLGEQIPETPLA